MPLNVHFFGSKGPQRIILGSGEGEDEVSVVLRRDLWFDHDVDGRWLVWAQGDAVAGADGQPDEIANTGAIVVTDATAIAFIDMLGRLLVDPAQFAHEPIFAVPEIENPA